MDEPDDSYDPFYLGEVRVTQSNHGQFMVYGDHVKGIWIARGQVHLDSEMQSEAEFNERGRLTVTRWFALSRKLTEAPKPRKRKTKTHPTKNRTPSPSASPSAHPHPSTSPSSTPQGFTSRNR